MAARPKDRSRRERPHKVISDIRWPLVAYRAEVFEAAIHGLDIGELRVHVEQVPEHRTGDAVANRLLDDDRPKTFGQAAASASAASRRWKPRAP